MLSIPASINTTGSTYYPADNGFGNGNSFTTYSGGNNAVGGGNFFSNLLNFSGGVVSTVLNIALGLFFLSVILQASVTN